MPTLKKRKTCLKCGRKIVMSKLLVIRSKELKRNIRSNVMTYFNYFYICVDCGLELSNQLNRYFDSKAGSLFKLK